MEMHAPIQVPCQVCYSHCGHIISTAELKREMSIQSSTVQQIADRDLEMLLTRLQSIGRQLISRKYTINPSCSTKTHSLNTEPSPAPIKCLSSLNLPLSSSSPVWLSAATWLATVALALSAML